MSVTEKQKAYHLRKMKTRMTKLNVKKDGYISRKDYELMVKRLAEYGKMSKEQAESTREQFMKVADFLNLKPGMKIPLDEAAQRASEVLLTRTEEEQKAGLYSMHNLIFDVMDTNSDGYISKEEFKVYFQAIGPGMSEGEVKRSFDAIDSNGDGQISREMFLAGGDEFMHGLEETEVSNVFFGHLLP